MSAHPTFDDFVMAVHGREPFPWQREMARLLVENSPPDVVTVPTGMGKTSVLDAWVWALAVQADRGAERVATTRAAFVVDRRVIVDAAFEHATVIQRALDEASGPATLWVGQRLSTLGHELERPLEVVRMRGGVTWSWRWLRQPDQPAVIVGTVDQFGSRLLFRGYGVGPRLRPIDAAMVGTDVTAFVDEAHLSTALSHTVRSCESLQSQASGTPLHRGVNVVAMSATPPVAIPESATRLSVGPDDLDHPVAARRLAAVKLAELVDLPPVKKAQAAESLAEEIASRARVLAAEGKVVAVVVNTIDVARRVFELLAAKQKGGPAVDAVLAIGRCRNIDRDASRRRWWARAAAGRTRSPGADGLVIVATQTIEVGADLDVDCLITEIAPIDALVQRFGRVDRLGWLGSTRSWIVRQPARSVAPENHVYGEAADSTWNWLERQGRFGPVDFGPEAMGERLRGLSNGERRELVAPTAPIPEVFGEILHQLARTNPTPNPDHPIDTYLHGVRDSQPTVSVVWRAGLAEGDAASVLAAAPATAAEAVEVPLVHVARFMRGEGSTATASDLDVVAAPESDQPLYQAKAETMPIQAWRVSEGGVKLLDRSGALRPGDLVVIDSAVGGHDEFGWTGRGDGRPVADVADLVRLGQAQLRVDPAVWASILSNEPGMHAFKASCEHLTQLAVSSLGGEETGSEVGESIRRAVGELLHAIRQSLAHVPLATEVAALISIFESFDGGAWKVVTAGRLTKESRLSACVVVDGYSIDDNGSVSHSGLRLVAPSQRVSLDHADDSELGSSAIGGEVSLDTHLGAVGTRAAAFASNLGLAEALVETMRLAGLAHDLGKADARFQAVLRGGDWLAAAAYDGDTSKALAKSAPGARAKPGALAPEWRWPKGMRHEAVSVALLRASRPDPTLDQELLEHLVAAHHGWSRPLFPAVIDDMPRPVVAIFEGEHLHAKSDDVVVDWAQPERFRRLCERYGWWGLALLESLLRLADISVSEEGS